MSARRQLPKVAEASAPATPLTRIAMATLLALLLILALRLTMSETIRETLGRKMADYAAKLAGKPSEVRIIGPDVTAWLCVATLALAAVAGVLAAAVRGVMLARLGKFLLIGVVVALAVASTFHAANRFDALIGTADLAMALAAGWTISVLCNSRLLGDRGRRIVIAAMVAILATWVAKGLYQRFSELPDTLAYFNEHKAEQLAAHGVDPNDTYYAGLFVSRLKSMEISGFLSFSNVMAAGMIGLVTILAGLLAVSFASTESKDKQDRPPDEVPVKVVLQVIGCLLVIVGMAVGVLTGSRGGSTLTIVCPVVFAAAVYWREQVWARRKVLIVAAVAIIVLGSAAVVSYGIARDRLPSKSLTFRWHYWTGAAKLVQQSPAMGVGLNNFSEYYGSVKRASSPEDVADPHSFFVRLAAETGLPATILIAALLVWIIATSLRWRDDAAEVRKKSPPSLRIFALALVASLTWWLIHYFVAEPAADFYLYLAVISAVLAAGAATLAIGLAEELSPLSLRMISLAALLGAVGMLAYDQINMAIVTGPVAMLFWMLLGLADSHDAVPANVSRANGILPAALCGASAVAMALLVAMPLSNDAMRWDPGPAEMRYIQAESQDPQAALAAIDQAIALSPRTLELLRARLELKLQLHQPAADDIRYMLTLDRANARIRISLASIESDLSPAERVQMLKEALQLDAQLPPDEIKRLSPEKIAEVNALIDRLSLR